MANGSFSCFYRLLIYPNSPLPYISFLFIFIHYKYKLWLYIAFCSAKYLLTFALPDRKWFQVFVTVVWKKFCKHWNPKKIKILLHLNLFTFNIIFKLIISKSGSFIDYFVVQFQTHISCWLTFFWNWYRRWVYVEDLAAPDIRGTTFNK